MPEKRERREYTAEEKIAYWRSKNRELEALLKQAGVSGRSGGRGSSRRSGARGTSGRARRSSGRGRYASSVSRRRGRAGGKASRYQRKRTKGSGCKINEEYQTKGGGVTVHIFAWRRIGGGKRQLINAYLSQDNGVPKSGADPDKYRSFVVNVSVPGVSECKVNGCWSAEFRKLTVVIGGEQLVANPATNYFGPGGKKFRSKVKA